jgi:hypothetical protein
MRYLSLTEVLELYRQVMEQSKGMVGVHNLGALESALAQPQMVFDEEELYPALVEKAAALGFSLIQNHRRTTSAVGLDDTKAYYRTNISLLLSKNTMRSLPPIPRSKPVSVPTAGRTKQLQRTV